MLDKHKRQLLGCLVAGMLTSLSSGVFADPGGERTSVVGAQLPVWTDELGQVPLNKYSREELSKMVDDFSTADRIKITIPISKL